MAGYQESLLADQQTGSESIIVRSDSCGRGVFGWWCFLALGLGGQKEEEKKTSKQTHSRSPAILDFRRESSASDSGGLRSISYVPLTTATHMHRLQAASNDLVHY
jgi:hypothetical protein